jgi:hypothetical protein
MFSTGQHKRVAEPAVEGAPPAKKLTVAVPKAAAKPGPKPGSTGAKKTCQRCNGATHHWKACPKLCHVCYTGAGAGVYHEKKEDCPHYQP